MRETLSLRGYWRKRRKRREEEEKDEEEKEVQMLFFKQISIITIKVSRTQKRLARTPPKKRFTPLFHVHSVHQIEQLSENKVKSFFCAEVKKKSSFP